MNLEIFKIGGSWVNTAVIGGLLLGTVYVLLAYGNQIKRFCSEVWVELQKCSWPWNPEQAGLKKYRELIDSTVVVIVSTILLAGFVTFTDFVLNQVIGFLTRS